MMNDARISAGERDAHISVMIARLAASSDLEIRVHDLSGSQVLGLSGTGGEGDGEIVVDDFFDRPCL